MEEPQSAAATKSEPSIGTEGRTLDRLVSPFLEVVVGAAENTRRVHAAVVVGLCRANKSESELESAIGNALDEYCETIRNGPEELTDTEVEGLRFATAIRTEINGGPPAGKE